MFELGWAKNGTPNTLTSSSATLAVTDLTATKFNTMLTHTIVTGGNVNTQFTLDGDTSTSYADRRSKDGAADNVQTSVAFWYGSYTDTPNDEFVVCYLINISGEEKLKIFNLIHRGTAGAGTAPNRVEGVGKFDTTAGQITRADYDDGSTGTYDIDSNMSFHGTD